MGFGRPSPWAILNSLREEGRDSGQEVSYVQTIFELASWFKDPTVSNSGHHVIIMSSRILQKEYSSSSPGQKNQLEKKRM